MSSLPDPRLVGTEHDSKGVSKVGVDAPQAISAPYGPSAPSFSLLHEVSSFPISNVTPYEKYNRDSFTVAPPGGAIFCTVDLLPGAASPMHRTLSLDYGAVLKGEVTMKLDDGSETVMKEGDTLVQKGTMHQWINNGTQPCRLLFVCIASEAVSTEDGTKLEPTMT